MEELLLNILAALAEVVLELAGEFILEAIVWGMRKVFISLVESNRFVNLLLVAASGLALGYASTGVFPHPLFHPSRFHGICVLVSPLITGLLMALAGRAARRRGSRPLAVASFRYGFTLALGMAAVRFWLVR
jgi:hypothetical protein